MRSATQKKTLDKKTGICGSILDALTQQGDAGLPYVGRRCLTPEAGAGEHAYAGDARGHVDLGVLALPLAHRVRQ